MPQGMRHRRDFIITPVIKYSIVVIVRLDRTIQNLNKKLDSPIKSGNDKHNNLKLLFVFI